MSLAYLAFAAALFGLIHHRIVAGVWWQWTDILHHEPLILACVAFGVGLLLGIAGVR